MVDMVLGTTYSLFLSRAQAEYRAKGAIWQVIHRFGGNLSWRCASTSTWTETFEAFFAKAKLHPNFGKITGVICGHRLEDIENPLTQKVRYLDKLVDELAKGKKMESVLRA